MDKCEARNEKNDVTNNNERMSSISPPQALISYMYSREKLFEIAYSPAAQCVPKDIARYRSEGNWSFLPGGSRGNSPQTIVEGRELKKKGDGLEREVLRRRPSDPRERIKEEKDSIVLSPQRRSFNTGCHVQLNSAHHNTAALLRPPSNIESRDNIDRDGTRDRRDQRRVGSGRIQLDKDRDQRPLRDDRRIDRKDDRRRDDRDTRDLRRDDRELRRDERDTREPRRDLRDVRRDERDTRDTRDTRDGRREDRREDKENRFDRSGGDRHRRDFERERSLPPREFPDSTHFGRRKNDRRYQRKEEEPEWFSGGPTSQTDTIELRGFDRGDESKEVVETDEVAQDRPGSRGQPQDTGHKDTERLSVTDKNGSMETNESSSPDAGQHSDNDRHTSPPVLANNFDLNKFFNLDIPGLPEGATPPPDTVVTMESRFTRWFNTANSHGNSRETSRKSSLAEDLYLNELVNTISRSPVCDLASSQDGGPRDLTASNDTYPSMLDEGFMSNTSAASDKHHNASSGNISPNGPTSQLKALLFGRKVTSDVSPASSLAAQNISTLNGITGRIKTVEELEADMRKMSMQQSPVLENITNMSSTPQTKPDVPGDLTAFNKLLSMMQANAAAASAATDSPKLSPIRLENRGASPMLQPLQNQITAAAIAQNEFWQAISRNKEKQIQIQQNALKHMKTAPHPLRLTQPGSALAQQATTPTQQETFLNLIKQQQQNLLQQALTPRSPSPHPMLQTQFLQQPPPSPRNPSPIMFSQQPPLNLNAPSPVNPAQLAAGQGSVRLNAPSPVTPAQLTPAPLCLSAPSPVYPAQLVQSTGIQSLTPNTLSVSSNKQISRVPSPQELIVHTQAIMQNALIKKQLEEQKERYNRKQQERAKSPSMYVTMVPQRPPNISNFVMSPMPLKSNVPASFTPTAVIRKMHSDKAEEKEKLPKYDNKADDSQSPADPCSTAVVGGEGSENGRITSVHNDILIQIEAASAPGSKSSTPSSLTQVPPPVMLHRPLPTHPQAQSDTNGQSDTAAEHSFQHADLTPVHARVPNQEPMRTVADHHQHHHHHHHQQQQHQQQLYNDATTLLSQVMRSGRPLVGSNIMQNTIPVQVQPVNSPNTFSGRPIVKGQVGGMMPPSPSHQHNNVLLQIPSVDPRPMMGGGPTQPLDVIKLLEQQRLRQLSPQPMVRSGIGGMSSPLLARMPPQPNPVNPLMIRPPINPAGMNPAVRNSAMLNHLSQLAALQHAQQRSLANRAVYPATPAMLNPRSTQAMSRGALSPQVPLQTSLLNCAPMSPNASFPTQMPSNFHDFLSANSNLVKSREANLSKWFGMDVLNTNLPPAFPPGKKVLTVDELEQNQQTVTY